MRKDSFEILNTGICKTIYISKSHSLRSFRYAAKGSPCLDFCDSFEFSDGDIEAFEYALFSFGLDWVEPSELRSGVSLKLIFDYLDFEDLGVAIREFRDIGVLTFGRI